MRVRDTKPKQLLSITNWLGGREYYLITEVQDVHDLVRAYKQLGEGVVYLDPTHPCELVTKEVLKGGVA